MDGVPPAHPAPDLFRALELEPVVGTPAPAEVPRMAAAVEQEIDDDTTNPVSVGIVGSRAAEGGEIDEERETISRAVVGAPSMGGGLADLLEPEALRAASTAGEVSHYIDDTSDDATARPAARPEAATPSYTSGADPESLLVDDEPRQRSFPAIWIALVLMLGGALAWVVLTQTDLQYGDVISRRDSEAVKQADAERDAAMAEVEAAKKEYGTISVNSVPEGAQVFMFKAGPTASFENLPRAHEYLLLIDAPGRVPELRRIKGTEISGRLLIDLDDAPDPDRIYPIPDAEPPKIAEQPNLEDVANLELESPNADVRFGLLVGYTPGVRLVDLEAEETHQLLVYKPGYEPHDIIVKGRHWEEMQDGLIYSETVSLVEAAPLAEGETDGDLVLGEEGTGGVDEAEGETEGAVEELPLPKPKKKRRKTKKKKKR